MLARDKLLSCDIDKHNEETRMKLQPEQIIAYYTSVLGRPLTYTKNKWIKTECPFHSDNLESLRINPATGEWRCPCGNGNIHEFQMRRDCSNDWREADDVINRTIEKELNACKGVDR
jgi:hypothetical protein